MLMLQCWLYLRSTPHPLTVTTRIITFLVGNPYKPSFATVTGWGVDPSFTCDRHWLPQLSISTSGGNGWRGGSRAHRPNPEGARNDISRAEVNFCGSAKGGEELLRWVGFYKFTFDCNCLIYTSRISIHNVFEINHRSSFQEICMVYTYFLHIHINLYNIVYVTCCLLIVDPPCQDSLSNISKMIKLPFSAVATTIQSFLQEDCGLIRILLCVQFFSC